jgi:Sulfate permease and related transporters (MFS superfamily)
LLLLKTEGVIHFANAQRIGELMSRLVEEHQPQVVVIDCSAIPDFEYTALKMLTEAEQRLRKTGVSLSLAALNPEPLELIRNSRLGEVLGRQRMHFNLEEAVRIFQAESAKKGAARAEELDEASPEQHDRARGHADNRRTKTLMNSEIGIGRSFPLGATIVEGGANFSLFSRRATGSRSTKKRFSMTSLR